MPLRSWELVERRCSESHILLKGVNVFLIVIFYLVVDLAEIWFRSAYNAFEQIQVSWKLVQKSSTYL
jgi:hypothetical protein